MSDPSITVASVTLADDGRVGSDAPQHRAPTMAPTPVAAARSARPCLALVQKDAIAAAVEEMDAKISPPARMVEYPPVISGGKKLFRYVKETGDELAALGVPEDLLTPHVRALWWELAEAIEAEAQKRV